MSEILDRIKADVRYKEGLKSCIACGVCTAICPAAEFFDYSPRKIILTVQSNDEEKILELLKGDEIWYCGQCLSCKTRCPRENVPGLIINVLRKVSQEMGFFVESRMGRQQLIIKRNTGQTILDYGYCIHPTTVKPELHVEQGPAWQWVFENYKKVYKRLNANIDQPGNGTLREIQPEVMDELKAIFDVTGGTEFFDTIEKFSSQKAQELGMSDENGNIDEYFDYISNE